MEEAGEAARASAKSAARKRNRKSRAGRDAAPVSGASGSRVDGSVSGTGAPVEAREGEPGCLVIDVVCGVNRAKLRVDGLRNGSKTPCVYMEADAAGELGQVEDKGQPRTGELKPRFEISVAFSLLCVL